MGGGGEGGGADTKVETHTEMFTLSFKSAVRKTVQAKTYIFEFVLHRKRI